MVRNIYGNHKQINKSGKRLMRVYGSRILKRFVEPRTRIWYDKNII